MKTGAVKMRYPGGDPENGPAYLQRWTGETWDCLHHKPEYDFEEQCVYCKNCGILIMSRKESLLITNKHLRKIK